MKYLGNISYKNVFFEIQTNFQTKNIGARMLLTFWILQIYFIISKELQKSQLVKIIFRNVADMFYYLNKSICIEKNIFHSINSKNSTIAEILPSSNCK